MAVSKTLRQRLDDIDSDTTHSTLGISTPPPTPSTSQPDLGPPASASATHIENQDGEPHLETANIKYRRNPWLVRINFN